MAKLYNPKEVQLNFGGHALEGFAEGTMVRIAYNSDMFTLSMGAQGKGSRAKTSDLSARITFELQQTSESNTVLSTFLQGDMASPVGIPLPFFMKDNNGTTLGLAATAWIIKYPDAEYGNSINSRSWVLETDALELFMGGNPDIGAGSIPIPPTP